MYFGKVQKGWKELYEEIIQTGKCVYCGACGAFCANILFDKENEIPIEDGSCKDMNTCKEGYGLCYNLCPKTETESISLSLLDNWVFGKKHDKILGHYLDIVSVKLTEKARKKIPTNAGPLTGLIWLAMENNLIDSSIITDKDDNFRPFPIIAQNSQDIIKGAGYKPSQGPLLSLLGDAINKESADIAVVGTPCQIQALRKLQNHPAFDYEAYDLVSLAIGTFCFGTYYNQLLKLVFNEFGIKASEIEKINTDKDNFNMNIICNSTVKEIPLNTLYEKAIRKACFSCSDYTASFADLSIGIYGSKEGWNTLIVRTERGKQVYELAIEQGFIETMPLEHNMKEIILDLTRSKTDIVKIESITQHSPEIKSITVRNSRIADAYKPGMFVILWLPDVDFLPMSISSINDDLIEVTFKKIGEGTSKLFDLTEGDSIGIRGPFGNAFNYEDSKNILVVGGGMGIAALTSLIETLKQNKSNVQVAIGAKDEDSLIFAERLLRLIPNTMCTTEDGSVGKKCVVTNPVEDLINNENFDLIITCGPEIMMKKVFELANSKNIEIQASLERKMKCGLGICGSCCIGANNNTPVCKDGPIFNSDQLKSFPKFGTYSK
ncbi:MAG: dihydroorotate dehydrogenase electron transfer subunit [Candidatus Lokiarchaeota archaeon]|nr:dihydroorotate dehydrogenase electron transfer subunit [Candidatus Lokiarchaeota archaeon]